MLDYDKISEFFKRGECGIHCSTKEEAVELLTAVKDLFPERVYETKGPNPNSTEWEHNGPETVYSLDINDPADMFEYASRDWHLENGWLISEFLEFVTCEQEVEDVDISDYLSVLF